MRGRVRLLVLGVGLVALAGLGLAVTRVLAPIASDIASGLTADSPRAVDGIPIRSVAETIQLRDVDALHGVAVAIEGWWWSAFPMHSCAPPHEPHGVLEFRCTVDEWLLSDVPQVLAEPGPNDEFTVHKPSKPYLQPYLQLVPEEEGRALLGLNPIRVVVVGHFDDPLAHECRPVAVAACADTFVIDRVAAAGGAPIAPSIWAIADAAPIRGIDDAWAIVAREIGPGAVQLKAVLVRASWVASIDPRTTLDRESSELVWYVWAADRATGRVGSFAIVDGDDTIREQTFPFPPIIAP